jgi:hypothetical protein
MGEQQYIATGLPHSGGLSGHPDLTEFSQSSTSQDTTFQDLADYSTVSTFTLPPQCDSSLLTPISSAASPPLHDIHQVTRHYSVAPGTPQSQECASPGNQKMYHNWSHLDLNAHNSGTSSPMAAQGPVNSEYIGSYVSEGRRTPAPPPQQYLGNFGVSDPSESQMSQPETPYYPLAMTQLDHHSSLPMRQPHHMAMETGHRDIARSMAHMPSISAPAGLNSSPSPQLRQEGRIGHDETVFMHHYTDENAHRGLSGSPGRRVLQANNRVKKPRPSRRQNRNPVKTQDPAAEHKNCYGQEVMPTLKPETPAQERCIWEARWKHRYSKGQNMWDNIWSEYSQQFEGQKVPKGRGARENLQMKFKRSRCKYLEWLPRDDDLLREAWQRDERDRYKRILNSFWELGGSRNMCLGVEDIEVRLVNHLKVEENMYMDSQADVNIRRRRRVKSQGKKRSDDDEDFQQDSGMSAAVDQITDPSEQDAVMDQVFGCREIKYEDDGSEDDMMDIHAWNHQMENKMDPRGYLERRAS